MSTLQDAEISHVTLCQIDDLIAGSGVAARVGDLQLAIFYLPESTPKIYAVSNYDPLGKANVISRGIVGDKGGKIVVSSPLYKQHFVLADGSCIEEPAMALQTYAIEITDGDVIVTL
jgi:nitrite reductase (NADH) small subunit